MTINLQLPHYEVEDPKGHLGQKIIDQTEIGGTLKLVNPDPEVAEHRSRAFDPRGEILEIFDLDHDAINYRLSAPVPIPILFLRGRVVQLGAEQYEVIQAPPVDIVELNRQHRLFQQGW